MEKLDISMDEFDRMAEKMRMEKIEGEGGDGDEREFKEGKDGKRHDAAGCG